MRIIKITKQPYFIFDSFQFMDVLVEDEKGVFEGSIVDPLLTTVLNSELPYTIEKGSLQLKLFEDET